MDELLVNQEKLTKIERLNLSNHSFPKTKAVRDKCTLGQLKEKKEDLFNQYLDSIK